MAGPRTPAKLARKLQELGAVPARVSAAIAAKIRGAIPAPPLGSVAVAASGGEVTVTQVRPHGPPIQGVLPSNGGSPAWRAAVAEETGRAVEEVLR